MFCQGSCFWTLCLFGYPGRYLKSLLFWGDYFYVALCHIAGVHIDQLACVFKQSSLADILNLSGTAFCHTLMYKVLGMFRQKESFLLLNCSWFLWTSKPFNTKTAYVLSGGAARSFGLELAVLSSNREERFFFLFLTVPCDLQDLSSPTIDWTQGPPQWKWVVLTTGPPREFSLFWGE